MFRISKTILKDGVLWQYSQPLKGLRTPQYIAVLCYFMPQIDPPKPLDRIFSPATIRIVGFPSLTFTS
jgi:hypothetical protein